jgi:hypothetical protein
MLTAYEAAESTSAGPSAPDQLQYRAGFDMCRSCVASWSSLLSHSKWRCRVGWGGEASELWSIW